jgi:hypothetical protein
MFIICKEEHSLLKYQNDLTAMLNLKKIIPTASCSLITAILLSSFQCSDEEGVNYYDLIPVFYINVKPDQQEISLGDTLWIKAAIPDTFNTMYSNSSGESIYWIDKYELPHFDFNSKLGLRKLTGDHLSLSQQPGATQYFQFFTKVGSITNLNKESGSLNFEYANHIYTAEIGLVPTATGVFTLHFIPPGFLDLSKILFGYGDGGNPNQGRYKTIIFNINLFGQNNKNLLIQHCKFTMDILPVPMNVYYVEKGTFTFEVK